MMNLGVEANGSERLIHVMVGPVMLEGNIHIPAEARGIVLHPTIAQ